MYDDEKQVIVTILASMGEEMVVEAKEETKSG